MEPLAALDEANLGAEVRHVAFLDGLNAASRRVYGLGGLGVAWLACGGLVAGLLHPAVTAFQAVLLGGAGLLVGLAWVRQVSRWWEGRLLRRAEAYGEASGCSVGALQAVALQVPSRWGFALGVLTPKARGS